MIKTTSRATLTRSMQHHLMNHVQWSIKQVPMVSLDVQIGLQLSIALSSVVFFESAIFEFLENLSRGVRGVNPDRLISRISDKLVQDCHRSSGLRAYADHYELLLGNRLPEVIGPDLWEGLDVLFALRNHLAHGRPIILDMHWGDEIPLTTNHLIPFEKVENYLKKMKLINCKPTHNLDLSDYVNEKVAEWAWKTAHNSILKVAERQIGHSRLYFSYLNSIDGVSYKVDRID